MPDQPTTPPDEPEDAMGVEPEAESGAGYGNHAPDAGEEHEDAKQPGSSG